MPRCIWKRPELSAERFCSSEKTALFTVVTFEAADVTPEMKLGSEEFRIPRSVEYTLDTPV